MTSEKQRQLLDQLQIQCRQVLGLDFIALVNEHFGVALRARRYSELEAHGESSEPNKRYRGPDDYGLEGFVLAEELAGALGCDDGEWAGHIGRGSRCDAAVAAIRRHLDSDIDEN